jgi:citrate lyase beta subunit
LFKAGVCGKMGAIAERSLTEYAPDAATLALALGIAKDHAETVYERVIEKLRREPVEDFRVDFEDGFGTRSQAEEDAAADAVTSEILKSEMLPAFFGIRIKSGGFRALTRILTQLGSHLPENFVVTLPKITNVAEVSALADALDALGSAAKIELMVETPQAIFILPKLVDAARGRCVAAHFGAYDYTASLGITAAYQGLRHPACDFARSLMQASLAGSGIRLSDGATNVLPVPVHRGGALTHLQILENKMAAQSAWKVHYENIRHALACGFYQGWDLHPVQLPARYAAVYSFFLEGLDAAAERLRNFIDKAARATMVGAVFDDAASGQGLLNYFLRAVDCGAIPEEEIPKLTGLTVEELRSGSFEKILSGR